MADLTYFYIKVNDNGQFVVMPTPVIESQISRLHDLGYTIYAEKQEALEEALNGANEKISKKSDLSMFNQADVDRIKAANRNCFAPVVHRHMEYHTMLQRYPLDDRDRRELVMCDLNDLCKKGGWMVIDIHTEILFEDHEVVRSITLEREVVSYDS